MHRTISHVLIFCCCYHLTNFLIYPSSNILNVITFFALTFLLNDEYGLKIRKIAGFYQDAVTQINCIVQEQETQTDARKSNHIQTETESVMSKLVQVKTETKEIKSTPSQVLENVKCASTGVQTELKDPEMTSTEVQPEQNGLKISALVQTESIILKGVSTQTIMEYNAGETEKPKSLNFTIRNEGLENISEPTTTSNASTCNTKAIRDSTYNPPSSQIIQLTKLDAYLMSPESVKEKLARLNISITSNASFSDTEDSSYETNKPPTFQRLRKIDTLDTCLMVSPESVKQRLAPSNLLTNSSNASLRNTEDIRDETNNPPGSQPIKTGSVKKTVPVINLSTWNCISPSITSSELAEEFSDFEQHLSINPVWCDSQTSLSDQSSEPNGQKKACKKSSGTWLKLKNQIKKIENPFRK